MPQSPKVRSFCAHGCIGFGPACNATGISTSCLVPGSSRAVVLHSVQALSYEVSAEIRHLKPLPMKNEIFSSLESKKDILIRKLMGE